MHRLGGQRWELRGEVSNVAPRETGGLAARVAPASFLSLLSLGAWNPGRSSPGALPTRWPSRWTSGVVVHRPRACSHEAPKRPFHVNYNSQRSLRRKLWRFGSRIRLPRDCLEAPPFFCSPAWLSPPFMPSCCLDPRTDRKSSLRTLTLLNLLVCSWSLRFLKDTNNGLYTLQPRRLPKRPNTFSKTGSFLSSKQRRL